MYQELDGDGSNLSWNVIITRQILVIIILLTGFSKRRSQSKGKHWDNDKI